MIIAIVVFVAMAALSPDRFLSSQNIVSMAFQFPEFAILALAMTITMMTGGIDLSVVGVANLTAVISALILVNFAGADMTGAPALLWLFVALGVARTVGGLAGLFNGILVARFGLPPILATLGSGLVFTGIAVAMTGGSAVMGFPDVVAWIGNAQLLLVPVPLIIFVLLAIVLHVILTKTSFGLKATMYGANPLAALFAAIDINKLLVRVYIISGVLLGSWKGLSRKFCKGRLWVQLPASCRPDCRSWRGKSLWWLWTCYGCCAGGSVDAVPVKRIEHAAGVKFCARADLGRFADICDGRQHDGLEPFQNVEPSQ